MLPSESWVLLKDTLEEANIDSCTGHAASQKVLQKLFIGEGKELLQVLISTLMILLSQQEEAVLVCFKHLLILPLLQKLCHQLGHHDLVLFYAILFVICLLDLTLRAPRHHGYYCLDPLKQDRVVV